MLSSAGPPGHDLYTRKMRCFNREKKKRRMGTGIIKNGGGRENKKKIKTGSPHSPRTPCPRGMLFSRLLVWILNLVSGVSFPPLRSTSLLLEPPGTAGVESNQGQLLDWSLLHDLLTNTPLPNPLFDPPRSPLPFASPLPLHKCDCDCESRLS